ncbi:MAG: YitT family protein [Oscillospiraceae bacterium]|nr:YitT family protein [Oscillospiraceae bacterium]
MIKKNSFDFAVIIFGGALYALSIVLFLEPNNIVNGGLTGIAIMLNYRLPQIPIGGAVLVMNLPLFIIGWRLLGHRFLVRTMAGTLASTMLIDILQAVEFPVPDCEPLAAAVLGGVLGGAGLGLVFGKGATTGGSDIAARLLKIPFPYTQMGSLVLFVDGCVILSSAFVFGSVNNAFFAVVCLFTAIQVTDLILYGVNAQWLAYIMSEKYEEINAAIHDRLGRGATLLNAEGGFTRAPRKVILCAVRRQQISPLKALAKEIDPDAFIIVSKTYEVLGEGFGTYDKHRV